MIFACVFIANFTNSATLIGNKTAFVGDKNTIGGEITEIVSAPGSENDNTFLASALAASAIGPSAGADLDLESEPYDDRDPLITGQDSLLPNQNPITVSLPEPKPAMPATPYYAVGPYLDGYFTFPTSGYNRGRLHAYNAVDISGGDSCLYENIPVFAAASGVISATYPTTSASRYANSGYGNNIVLLHPNGVITRYAHLKNIPVISGQYVNQGSIIGFMGGYPQTSGAGNSTGCHLHFEVRGAKNPFVR